MWKTCITTTPSQVLCKGMYWTAKQDTHTFVCIIGQPADLVVHEAQQLTQQPVMQMARMLLQAGRQAGRQAGITLSKENIVPRLCKTNRESAGVQGWGVGELEGGVL